MIDLLGKRPFVGRGDDMDKWLDANRGGERSAPPPLENPPLGDGPLPSPTAAISTTKDIL